MKISFRMALRTLAMSPLTLLLSLPGGAIASDCTGKSCHAIPAREVVVHVPFEQNECTSCHEPAPGFSAENVHGPESFIGSPSSRERCGACHGERAERTSGAFAHTPSGEGECGLCHNGHYSTIPDLLKAAYPPGMITVYGTAKYALCWGCHDTALATEKSTVTGTRFRVGKRNFHYSHLHKRRGMSCRTCHDAHGSGQPFAIRITAPEGSSGWSGEMIFKSTNNGGRCIGGCHRDISYRP
ncbi:cytochrome c3 family protein [Candidatus Moduliflexota bacterium]